jgi:hypothetical protein
MKAALKTPSAKSLLKVLGSLKATKNASAYIEAPKKVAISMSLKYPSTLLIKVKKLKTEVEDNKFMYFY